MIMQNMCSEYLCYKGLNERGEDAVYSHDVA